MPTFSLLTLNVFGVPAPGTRRRLHWLATTLNAEAQTVVCLQEVQAHTYRRQIVRDADAYPASAFEPFIHAPKGGLLTLAAAHIEDSRFILYHERGLWFTPALADWILHKGVLLTRLTVSGQPIVVLNTHLTANYIGDWRESNVYARHEHKQLEELAELVRAEPAETLVVVCGDFNVPRGTWLYDSFIASSGLTDPRADAIEATYHPRTGMPTRFRGHVIDYALFRAPSLPDLTVESRLRFKDRIPHDGHEFYPSDHAGVELKLSWHRPSPPAPLPQGEG